MTIRSLEMKAIFAAVILTLLSPSAFPADAAKVKNKEPEPGSRIVVKETEASNPACVSTYALDRYSQRAEVKRLTLKPPKDVGAVGAKENPSMHAVQQALYESRLVERPQHGED